MKDVSFRTDDGIDIKGSMAIPERDNDKYPAVILIHEGESNRSEWSGFFEKVSGEGFAVLSYDIRGHGSSNKVDDLDSLYNDPHQAPRDLKAAITFLKLQPQVESSRLGIVGASLGGNLACVGKAEMEIKTAVVISAKTSAVFNLAGKDNLELKTVFYIASDGDEGGQRTDWAEELHAKTSNPTKVKIVSDSSAHGVKIFEDLPEVEEDILQWLKQTL